MPGVNPEYRKPNIRPAWLIWATVFLCSAIYVGIAQIASHVTTINLHLNLNSTAEVRILRLVDDHLSFQLRFTALERERRPELGSGGDLNKEHDLLKFDPGTEVQIVVSTPSSSPVLYEAMPLSGFYRREWAVRRMTANHAIQPGVYRWPPPRSTPTIHLHAGINSVRFEVASVGDPLAGETVDIDVLPPLGFKEGQQSVAWLWFGLWWPIFLVVLIFWAACLCHGGLRRCEVPM